MATEVREYQDYTQPNTFEQGTDFHIDIPLAEQNAIERNARNAANCQTRHERVSRSVLRKDGYVPDLKGRSYEEVQREVEKIKVGEYFSSWYEFNRCLESLAVLTGRGATKYATKRNYQVRVCKFGKTHRGETWISSTTTLQEADVIAEEVPVNDDNHENLPWGAQPADWAALDSSVAGNIVQAVSATPVIQRTPLGTLDVNRVVDAQQNAQQAVSVTTSGALTIVNNSQPREARPVVRHTRAWLPTRNLARHGRRISRTGACGELTQFLPPESDDLHGSKNEDNTCPFRVRAQCLRKTGRIEITKAELKHTCPQFPHKWRGPTRKAHWMAVTLAPLVVRNTRIPVKEMLDGLSMQYHRSSIYPQMWRAKDHIRDWYLGGQKASFHRILALCQRLVETDPQSIVMWCTGEDSSTFKRAFVCPSATRNALQCVQPMIYLDACHTKNCKYPTQLFLATTLDGNSKVVILCYAIAEVENTDNWIWFLQQMRRALHGIDNLDIPILSDRQKGLMAAVREVFPRKVHAHCANHLRANVKKKLGKAVELFFVALVYANTKAEFNNLLDRLKEGAAKGAAAVSYIEKLDASLWARHAFPLPRLGKVSSNPAEQANSGLLPIREFAPFKLMVELMHYLTIQFKARRIKAGQARDMYTDTTMLRHNVNLRHFQRWQVIDDGHHTAKVMSRDGVDEFLVRLHPRVSCTCFELQEMIWPCEHIMAWDDREGRDFRRHFHRCWKNSSLRSLYAPTLPCFLVNDLPMTTDCFPPAIAVQKGRHRMVRIEGGRGSRLRTSQDPAIHIDSQGQLFITYPVHDDPGVVEGMPNPGGSSNTQNIGRQRKRKSGEQGRQRKCGLCRGLGHNRRSCHLGAQPDSPPTNNDVPANMPVEEEIIMPLAGSAPAPTQADPTENDPRLRYGSSTEDKGQQPEVTYSGEWDSGGVIPIVNQNGIQYFVTEAENVRN